MSSLKPTIVLVHGAGVDPSFYAPLTKRLITRDYTALCPLLPSCAPTATSSTDLIDDALAIRSILTRLIEYESKTVILLMHSYGALVGSEAVPDYLTSTSRQKSGLSGGVKHLVYLSAFMLPSGASVSSAYGGIQGIRDGEFYTHTDPKTTMFGDFPDVEADEWMLKLNKHPTAVQTAKTTRAAYEFVPSTYVVFTEDLSVPVVVQEGFAKGMGSRVVRFVGGHMAPLSKGGELGDAVDGIVKEIA